MHATDPLPGIAGGEEKLGCYSRLYTSSAQVLEPASVDELRQIFDLARKEKRRVTFRAGGHSFDAQALGDDLVVSMLRFNEIEVLADERKVRVGAGRQLGRDPRRDSSRSASCPGSR